MSTRRYLSPLRYPGGKARMAAALARVFAGQHSTMDVEVWMEPFAGGGGAGLHLLDNGDVAERRTNGPPGTGPPAHVMGTRRRTC